MAALLQPQPETIRHVADLLLAGEIVALPTETVYGLAADATNASAVEKIYAAKNRPPSNPLIIHCNNLDMVDEYAYTNVPLFEILSKKFWPGPLTIVLPRKSGLADTVTAGLDSVAVRLPQQPVMQKVIEAVGRPLAAPSANPSGYVSPTTAQHVIDSLGDNISAILDGGSCACGLESTIVMLTSSGRPRILRPGPVRMNELERVTGCQFDSLEIRNTPDDAQRAPGMLTTHYQPRARLLLWQGDASDIKPSTANDALIYFAERPPNAGTFNVVNHLGGGLLEQAERELYATLREMDALGVETIYMEVPRDTYSPALLDRINRASSGWA